MPFRMLLMLLSLLPLFPDGDPDPPADPPAPTPDPDELGDPGKAALKAEREARKTAEKAAKDAQAEVDRMKAEAQKAKDAEAAEQGKWKELAEKRDADLSETTTRLTAAESELTTLREYVTADVEIVAKTVKDAAKDNPAAKILLDFHPGEDAATADLIAWTKRAKAQLPELATKTSPRGNGQDPKPGGKTIDEKQAVAQARRAMPRL